MVKKVKRFFIFALFMMIYPLASRQISNQKAAQMTGIGRWSPFRLGIPPANAKCCPEGSTIVKHGQCY